MPVGARLLQQSLRREFAYYKAKTILLPWELLRKLLGSAATSHNTIISTGLLRCKGLQGRLGRMDLLSPELKLFVKAVKYESLRERQTER